jgi:hypothetical protein
VGYTEDRDYAEEQLDELANDNTASDAGTEAE